MAPTCTWNHRICHKWHTAGVHSTALNGGMQGLKAAFPSWTLEEARLHHTKETSQEQDTRIAVGRVPDGPQLLAQQSSLHNDWACERDGCTLGLGRVTWHSPKGRDPWWAWPNQASP